jgi:type IV secretory pathway TraG/TraD family ATPase VirD4
MIDNSLITLTVIIFGVLILLVMVFFAWKIYAREWKNNLGTYCYSEDAIPHAVSPVLQKNKEAHGDFLEKRNDFLFGFGQIIIIGVIIIVLAVLLLLEKISPEAGLPIISALSGFAIAKTTGTARTRTESEQQR